MAYTKELADIAEWFINSGMEGLTGKQVASIIRKWEPDTQKSNTCPYCIKGKEKANGVLVRCRFCSGTGQADNL